MESEFVLFKTPEEADAFYKKITPKKWDDGKAKNKDFSKWMSHMSLEAIIDLWQVPLPDAYRIHDMKIGEIAAPTKMAGGYGVFRLKNKKDADLKEYTDKKKGEYLKILKDVYLYDNSTKIIQDIMNNANLVDYEKQKTLVFETTAGSFEVRLFTDAAPKACENMTKLMEKGYYNGTVFHRVIKGFMVQGGDPTATGRGGESAWGKDFEDEVSGGLQFDRKGLLAMANRGPHTNGSQFFITLAPTTHLNSKHTIFGEVVKGYEVVEKIGLTPTDKDDKPLTDQKIISLSIKKWTKPVSS